MTHRISPPPPKPRPRRLLTQNSELKRIGVWNWTLPALGARLPDGRTIATCPSAGVCARVCYARNGTYRIPAVHARHVANLAYVVDDPDGWEWAMLAELDAPRFREAWVRIHDSGDFFSDPYLTAWLRIITARPQVNFYAYTKEVDRFRRLVEPNPPPNFRWVYSLGGTQDHDLDPGHDRVADVFPTEEAIHAAGWHSQDASDLLAVLGPAPVGIPANNIARFRRRQGDRTFGQWQAHTRCRHQRAGAAEHRLCPAPHSQAHAEPSTTQLNAHRTGRATPPHHPRRTPDRPVPTASDARRTRHGGELPQTGAPLPPDRHPCDRPEVTP
jgi:Gene product 88